MVNLLNQEWTRLNLITLDILSVGSNNVPECKNEAPRGNARGYHHFTIHNSGTTGNRKIVERNPSEAPLGGEGGSIST